ncbi:MAG TPA: hypothetical protein EYQ80_06945, partial [Candidatus Poseidoniales archaeon]|nr:hypothetical protein [Candidatus Poseidoniales archaeon]
MASWLSIHAPKRFDALAMPDSIRTQLMRASIAGNPPHLLLTGPAGVGKTAAWRLVARQVLGPGWKSTSHVLQARDLARQAKAMNIFEQFLRPGGTGSSALWRTHATPADNSGSDDSVLGDIPLQPPAGG